MTACVTKEYREAEVMSWHRGVNSPMVPGLAVGLLRMIFGLVWLDLTWQAAPWVIH